MIALWLNILNAYRERLGHIIRGLTVDIAELPHSAESDRLVAALTKCQALKNAADQAIHFLGILKEGGCPYQPHFWVGPEIGHEIRDLLTDIIEAENRLDTRPRGVHAELKKRPAGK